MVTLQLEAAVQWSRFPSWSCGAFFAPLTTRITCQVIMIPSNFYMIAFSFNLKAGASVFTVFTVLFLIYQCSLPTEFPIE